MRPCYYNDSDPFVCAWLRNLIAAAHLPAGEVDERPIQEVQPNDVRGFAQCHFFAGIGGWAYALHLAEWGDRPVWTGSCPCQPFSAAGQRKSHADKRHLWPAWFRLIRECRPDTIFGEQVSGAAGLGWLDAVALDLEAADYAVGACVLGAHSVGAPHLRQRLWFVADTSGWGQQKEERDLHARECNTPRSGEDMANATGTGGRRSNTSPEGRNGRRQGKAGRGRAAAHSGMGHSSGTTRSRPARFGPTMVRSRFETELRASGLGVRPKDARDTFALWCDLAGIPEAWKRSLLGHGPRNVTQAYGWQESERILHEAEAALKALLEAKKIMTPEPQKAGA